MKWIVVLILVQAVSVQATTCEEAFLSLKGDISSLKGDISSLLRGKSIKEIEEIAKKAKRSLKAYTDHNSQISGPKELKVLILKAQHLMDENKAQKDVFKVSYLIHKHLKYGLSAFYPVSTEDFIENRPKYIAEAERLVKKYKDLRSENGDNTLLNIAVHKQSEDFVRLCLKWGCGAEDIKNSSPVLGYDAIKFGDMNMVKLLHSAGFDFGASAYSVGLFAEATYLEIALQRGFVEVAEFLSQNYPQLLYKTDRNKHDSLLFYSLGPIDSDSKMKSLKFLKKIGFDFANARDQFGNTGLHYLSKYEGYESDVFKFLLKEGGIDPLVMNDAGEMFFEESRAGYSSTKYKKLLRKLLKEENNKTFGEKVSGFFKRSTI